MFEKKNKLEQEKKINEENQKNLFELQEKKNMEIEIELENKYENKYKNKINELQIENEKKSNEFKTEFESNQQNEINYYKNLLTCKTEKIATQYKNTDDINTILKVFAKPKKVSDFIENNTGGYGSIGHVQLIKYNINGKSLPNLTPKIDYPESKYLMKIQMKGHGDGSEAINEKNIFEHLKTEGGSEYDECIVKYYGEALLVNRNNLEPFHDAKIQNAQGILLHRCEYSLSDVISNSEESRRKKKLNEWFHITKNKYKLIQLLWRAIIFLHRKAVAHLDVKSANVLIQLPPQPPDYENYVFNNTKILICDFNHSILLKSQGNNSKTFNGIITNRGTKGYQWMDWFNIKNCNYMQNKKLIPIPHGYYTDYFATAITTIEMMMNICMTKYINYDPKEERFQQFFLLYQQNMHEHAS
jgi:hypothetical protein